MLINHTPSDCPALSTVQAAELVRTSLSPNFQNPQRSSQKVPGKNNSNHLIMASRKCKCKYSTISASQRHRNGGIPRSIPLQQATTALRTPLRSTALAACPKRKHIHPKRGAKPAHPKATPSTVLPSCCSSSPPKRIQYRVLLDQSSPIPDFSIPK